MTSTMKSTKVLLILRGTSLTNRMVSKVGLLTNLSQIHALFHFALFSEYKIVSSRPSSSFGHALKLADMNGDGVDDLVIGAPSYYDEAAGSSRVQGCVFVVLVCLSLQIR